MTAIPGMPEVSQRVSALHARMTLEEKLAQLVGFWVDQGGSVVAPMQGEMASSGRLEEATVHGIGHLTRVYGTRPVDPVERAAWLWREQRRLHTQTRLGIPALVHEESRSLVISKWSSVNDARRPIQGTHGTQARPCVLRSLSDQAVISACP